jgi:hypothetical protein
MKWPSSFILILVCCQFVSATQPASHIKEDFGFLHKCKSERNKICLLGEFEKGLFIFLLGTKKPHVCTARTGEHVKDEFESGSVSYTELINLVNCENLDDYSIGYVGKPPEMDTFDTVSLLEISDAALKNELAAKVRKTNVLQTLLDQNAGVAGLYKPDKDLNSVPQVLQYPVPEAKVYILTYDLTWKSDEVLPIGPRVVIINDSIQGLTGQCSYKEIRAFTMRGEYYIESGSHCCECGITGQELFKIEGNKIKHVYEDFSFSD